MELKQHLDVLGSGGWRIEIRTSDDFVIRVLHYLSV